MRSLLVALFLATLLVPVSARDEFPEQALVLMVRDPDAHREALLAEARNTPRDVEWLAICNALVERKAEGVAAMLVGDLTIRARIVVVENENVGYGTGPGRGWGSGCGGGVRVPDGFPPFAEYRLSRWQRAGDVVLAPGPVTIYYSRNVVPAGGAFGGSRSDTTEDRDERRVEYLGELLGAARDELELTAKPSYTVVWTDEAAFRDEYARIESELKRKLRKIARQLGVDAEPRVEIEVEDRRSE